MSSLCARLSGCVSLFAGVHPRGRGPAAVPRGQQLQHLSAHAKTGVLPRDPALLWPHRAHAVRGCVARIVCMCMFDSVFECVFEWERLCVCVFECVFDWVFEWERLCLCVFDWVFEWVSACACVFDCARECV